MTLEMTRELAAIDRNINRIRRDIRRCSVQMQARIDADEDCSEAALVLMRAQADLRLYLARRQRLAERSPIEMSRLEAS